MNDRCTTSSTRARLSWSLGFCTAALLLGCGPSTETSRATASAAASRSYATLLADLRAFVKGCLGDTPLREIEESVWDQVGDWRRREGLNRPARRSGIAREKYAARLEIPAQSRSLGFAHLLLPQLILALSRIADGSGPLSREEKRRCVAFSKLAAATRFLPVRTGWSQNRGTVRGEVLRWLHWFDAEARSPAGLAAFVLIMAQGPFCGLPVVGKVEAAETLSSVKLDSGATVEVVRQAGKHDEPIVLRARSGSVQLWAVRMSISRFPGDRVVGAEPRELEDRLRRYGSYAISFRFHTKIGVGGEEATVYVTPDGTRLLFYSFTI